MNCEHAHRAMRTHLANMNKTTIRIKTAFLYNLFFEVSARVVFVGLGIFSENLFTTINYQDKKRERCNRIYQKSYNYYNFNSKSDAIEKVDT